MVFAASEGVVGMQQAIDNLCLEVEQTVDKGYNYIILSDKAINDTYAPIPSLIVMSAVHHHLIKSKNVHKRQLSSKVVRLCRLWMSLYSQDMVPVQ